MWLYFALSTAYSLLLKGERWEPPYGFMRFHKIALFSLFVMGGLLYFGISIDILIGTVVATLLGAVFSIMNFYYANAKIKTSIRGIVNSEK